MSRKFILENPFKGHSAKAMEECLAKALSELLGQEIEVEIGDLKYPSAEQVIPRDVTFTVRAAIPRPGFGLGDDDKG